MHLSAPVLDDLYFAGLLHDIGITGVLFMIAGFTTFTFTLLLHATAAVVWRKT